MFRQLLYLWNYIQPPHYLNGTMKTAKVTLLQSRRVHFVAPNIVFFLLFFFFAVVATETLSTKEL